MVLAVGQEMQIFSSPNLKDWAFESSFGEGYGAHGNVWECPDLFELPVEGTNEKKWVLLCSLGDGPFGDSATQYLSVASTARNLVVTISRMSRNGWTGEKTIMLQLLGAMPPTTAVSPLHG